MSFEQLDVWKRSVQLSAAIYKELASLKDYAFRNQITRSSLSLPSNIAEGLERGTVKESVRFLFIAKGSAGELRTQLLIGLDIGYIPQAQAEVWVQETREISAMLVGLINSIK
jgi:four helix bundle protein